MKKILALLSLFATSSLLFGAATLPEYEPFNYTAGSDLGTTGAAGGNVNWAWGHIATTASGYAHAAGDTINVASTTLSYPGLSLPSGGFNAITNPPCASTGGIGEGLRLAAGTGNALGTGGATAWYSALIRVESLANLTTGGTVLMGFNNTLASTDQGAAPSVVFARTLLRLSTTSGKFNVGLDYGGTSAQPILAGGGQWAATDFSPGQTVLVVVCWTNETATVGTAHGTMWINPDPTTLGAANPPAGTIVLGNGGLTGSGSGTTAQIASLLVWNGQLTSQGGPAPLYTVDEIHIMNTSAASVWAQIAPAGTPAFTNTLVASTNIAVGDTITIDPGATGPGITSYSWQKNAANITDGNASGTTSAKLTISSATAANTGTYDLIVQNAQGTVTSSSIFVFVGDPVIKVQPIANQTNAPGTSAQMSVTAAGTAPLAYQWFKGATQLSDAVGHITGSSSSSLTLNNVSSADQGSYTCIVTNGASATAASANSVLVILDPFITASPSSITRVAGQTAAFSVSAAGTSLTYRWFQGATQLVDGQTPEGAGNGTISGATTSTLSLANITTADSGFSCYCVVDSSVDSPSAQTSATATLTVGTFSVVSPVSKTERVGDHVAFVASVSSSLASTNFSYQWKSNGVPISGATSAVLNLTSIQTSYAANYSVDISAGNSLAASSSATLNVFSGYSPYAAGNVVVSRVGDGVQGLGYAAGGNTVYIDQYSSAGSYVNTTMIPDSAVSGGLVVNSTDPAAANLFAGLFDATLATSPNNRYVGMAGYNVNQGINGKPNSTDSYASSPRGAGVVNGLGYYQMTWKNDGTVSGLTTSPNPLEIHTAQPDNTGANFWITGAGPSTAPGFFYVNNTTVTAIAGSGLANPVIRAFTNSVAGRIDLCYTAGVTSEGSTRQVAVISGLPTTAATAKSILNLTGAGPQTGMTNLNDVAISPDTNTIYLCEAEQQGTANLNGGGIQRWDWDATNLKYTNAYVINNGPLANGVGARNMVVDWSNWVPDGAGGLGSNAVIYATTGEVNNNKLVKVADNGTYTLGTSALSNALSTVTKIADAGVNQQFHGVQFTPTADAAAITAAPQNATNNFGDQIVLSATVTGSAPLGMFWMKGNTVLQNSGHISGSSTASLTVNSASYLDRDTYTLVVTNGAGTTSASAIVAVDDPHIASQPTPASQTVGAGLNVTYTVGAVGTSLTYAWFKNGNPLTDGANPWGSTNVGTATASFTLQDTHIGNDSGVYTCVITGAGGTQTSSPVTLTVSDPGIATQPQGASKNYGDSVSFSVVPTGTSPFTYQWYKNGTAFSNGTTVNGAQISGSTTSTLVIGSPLAFSDTGSYTVVVSNNVGSATSSPAVLTVKDPIITSSPANAGVVAGNSASFSVTAVGSGIISYQWKKGANALSNGGHVSGAGSSTLVISPANSADAGLYSCDVSGADSTISNSGTATLTVTNPVSIVAGPLNRKLQVGDHVAFTVTAAQGSIANPNGTITAATGTITYQWTKTGGSISAVTTASALSLVSLQISDSDTYTITVNDTQLGVPATATAALDVTSGLRALSSGNLIVSRVGDGVQTLATNGGNTIYLDQYTTGGSYVSSLMIPDSGTGSLVAHGADISASSGLGLLEAGLTSSSDNSVLTLAAYNVTRPYSSSGPISGDNASAAPRGIATIDARGLYHFALQINNSAISGTFRAAVTDTTQTNFWCIGGTVGVRYFNTGSTGAGTLINNASANCRFISIFNGDIYFDSGIDHVINKLPATPTTATASNAVIAYPLTNIINEFSVSPDAKTIYLTGANTAATGGTGVERWNLNGSTWSSNKVFIAPSDPGARGLAVDWSSFTGGGAAGTGAVLYFTTTETNNNKLVKVVDAASPTTTILNTAGTNTLFRSVKFAPTSIPVGIAAGPTPANAIATNGSSVTFTLTASGTAPITYQWFKTGNVSPLTDGAKYSGTASGVLTILNAASADDGSYTCTVGNNFGSNVSSSPATLAVVDPVSITSGLSDETLNSGQTAVFTVTATGGGTLSYQWSKGNTVLVNGGNVSGAATSSLSLANTVVADSDTYTVQVSNGANSASSTAVLTVNQSIPVAITNGPTPSSLLNVPQGTNFTLTVGASGSSPLSYQWYTVEGGLVPGATSGTNEFTAQPAGVPGPKFATNHYYVVVTGPANTVTSGNASVQIALDTHAPTVVVKSPVTKGFYGTVSPAQSFAIAGTATDQIHGNIQRVRYFFINSNTPPFTPSQTYDAQVVPINGNLANQSFSVTTNPPLPGTNSITVWAEDLAGHITAPPKTVVFFYAVPIPFTLHKLGDGTGNVSFKTKLKDKPATVVFGSATADTVVLLNVGETYTLSYTPDRKNKPTDTPAKVFSVLSNAPGMGPLTNTIKKYIGADITVQSNFTDVTFEIDRDRFADMAGNYNAVFTANGVPQNETSRYLHMTVTPTRKLSGFLKNEINAKDLLNAAVFNADGSVTISSAAGVTITGNLAWTGSEDPTSIKQFTGSAIIATSNATVVADREDALAIPNPGFATMEIPPSTNSDGIAGTGYSTIKAKNGVITSTSTLADDDKQSVVWALKGSRSGNVPQWIVTKTGVLFGNLIVSDGLTNLSAPALSWIRSKVVPAPSPYSTMLPNGFTNSPFAGICSPYNGLGINGTFTLSLSGGNLLNDTNTTVTFNGFTMTTNGPVTAGKVDANGKVTIVFLDGLPSKHKTTAIGTVLQNATNGAGFFIRNAAGHAPTNSGNMTLTPQ